MRFTQDTSRPGDPDATALEITVEVFDKKTDGSHNPLVLEIDGASYAAPWKTARVTERRADDGDVVGWN